MQPDNSQPNNQLPPVAGQVQFGTPTGQSLPPADPTNLGVPPGLPAPANPGSGLPDTIESWIPRVEHIINSEPNPRRRADAINRLKNEYQQNVLGIVPKPPEGST